MDLILIKIFVLTVDILLHDLFHCRQSASEKKKSFSKGQVDKVQGKIIQQPRTAWGVQKEGEREVRFGDVAGVISNKHMTVHTHTAF